LDSLVFVDDSPFEINLIKEKLPEVKTITVPNLLYEYHKIIQENLPLFFSMNKTVEDKARAKMYKQNMERAQILNSVENIEDYLSKLEISIIITRKDKSALDRIVQLTQKTNQFNLTTKRYANGNVQLFFDSPNYDVLSLNVKDKFGDFGITGVCIIKYDEEKAYLDTFLMSCRILGRNIEKVFIREILQYLDSKGLLEVRASYLKTIKNNQVENFYESNGFELIESIDSEKKNKFNLEIIKQEFNTINYIKVLLKVE
jgi:FkbH-like protein